ncbi:uncharacterized protein EV420DRAFT_1748673 [Desarmillaria tabescens]|uniref:F-box domain-containing protein n=1 Tax=Armillaria tabescens TaxID=1929756 RepID=A0AA39N4E8_ARMTA|nr:uncharacterized protein EV420DRAFT_1748673 [Desarmillaria tabescens]KAK0457532.1 hypothetical protein EV420DRAFT_1748673 [Desarmillaria tabescens]
MFHNILVSIRRIEKDTCSNCEFNAIHQYTPSVDATELLRSGSSSFDVPSILNDISHLEHELQNIEPLFIKFRDRYNNLVKNLGSCKALLAPIRSLPAEILLQIFSLASSHIPDPFEVPWILGHVCSTWRNISRSSPSLWANLHLTESSSKRLTFLKEYISLLDDAPVHLSLDERPEKELKELIHGILIHSELWSSLELKMSAGWIEELLSYASFLAFNLKKFSINLTGPFEINLVEHRPHVLDLLSSSPIRELHLECIPYSHAPINITELQKFSTYSYDPAELHSIFRNAKRLVEFVITPGQARSDFVSDIPSTSYPYTCHTSLERLSFVITMENWSRSFSKIPSIFDHVSFPALKHFEILQHDGYDMVWFDTTEYLRLHDLFRRSQCSLTVLTFSAPISVDSLLIPLLAQSPTLHKLNIFLRRDIVKDIFKALSLEQGMAPNLKEPCITEAPRTLTQACLLEEADQFYAMILSRADGDSGGRLEKLRVSFDSSRGDHEWMTLPVSHDSPFRNLLRMKERGMNIEFLLDGKDYINDGKARVAFFGS